MRGGSDGQRQQWDAPADEMKFQVESVDSRIISDQDIEDVECKDRGPKECANSKDLDHGDLRITSGIGRYINYRSRDRRHQISER